MAILVWSVALWGSVPSEGGWGGKNGYDKMNNGRTPSAVISACPWTAWVFAVHCQYLIATL